jgi:hypothetical protein
LHSELIRISIESSPRKILFNSFLQFFGRISRLKYLNIEIKVKIIRNKICSWIKDSEKCEKINRKKIVAVKVRKKKFLNFCETLNFHNLKKIKILKNPKRTKSIFLD